MKTLVVVQARMASTRLPGKVALPVAGAPILTRMLERVCAAETPFDLVVATTLDAEDDVVVDIAERAGHRVYRGHKSDLLDRHFHAALDARADVVVKIPSDCPLLDPGAVDRVLARYAELAATAAGIDYASNLHPATYPDGNDVEAFSMEALERAHVFATRPMEREHTTPYLWERPAQFRLANVIWETGLDLSMSHRFTLDYPADYAFVAAVYDELYTPHRPVFPLSEILQLLEARPDIFVLNARYAGVNWYRHHLAELTTVGAAQTRQSRDPMTNAFATPDLEALALRVRAHIVRMAGGGGCFIGASLSCADILVCLYANVLNLTPETLSDPTRDYFLLSKGHDVPALYGTLAELGYLPRQRLAAHLSTRDALYWHPNRAVPGVEFHSGSLGHLLSVGVGVALDIKMRRGDNRVFVLVGDGELNEGSVWEALLVASAKRLDNLVVIVDRNEFQANVRTEDLIPLEPLADKFQSFGAAVTRVSGHSFEALGGAFAQLPFAVGRPSVVIADTVRGKGLPSLERRADRWFSSFTDAEVSVLLAELHGEASALLTSEPLMVR